MLTAWFLVMCGITTLLVAANRGQRNHVCREVIVGIKGTGEKFYIDKGDVLMLMDKTAGGSLVNKLVSGINLSRLERSLESNSWIRNAELYFDSRDALHVFVEEREPVARVFTAAGSSFYIDSSGHRMPLLEKVSARVPVVTGFPNGKKLNVLDSALLDETRQVAVFIYNHAFWNAQIGQIDITPERKFELIPVVGDHIIRLGNAENIDQKMKRLYVFYRQVLSKVGFSKYSALDIEFDGQVVAVSKQPVSEIDTLQLQKNIADLQKKASLQNVEEEMLPVKNSIPVLADSSGAGKSDQVNQPDLQGTQPAGSIASPDAQPGPGKASQPVRTLAGTHAAKEKSGTGEARQGKKVKAQRPKVMMKKRH